MIDAIARGGEWFIGVPQKVRDKAIARGMNAHMIVGFVDHSKTMIDMAVLAFVDGGQP